MSRSRAANQASVSLFPFLAVLLCTMGALIVVLVVLARQSRPQAAAPAESPSQPDHSHLKMAREDAQWFIQRLEESNAATSDDLERQQREVAHYEEDARKLRKQLESLQRAFERLQETSPGGNDELAALEKELRQMQRDSAKAERDLAAARARPAARPSYSVTPYFGPNGTDRRPVYIECRADSIVLQPEGIKLTERDFLGPMTPGNPLAAALRAAREHIAAGKNAGSENAEPYPLLLVRPGGIAAYYVARAAMESWGDDFGYELVDEDWTLKFPPADPALAEAMQMAVEDGRRRQAVYALAAPGPGGPRKVYRAGPTGGVWSQDAEPGVDAGAEAVTLWSDRRQAGAPQAAGLGGAGGRNGIGQAGAIRNGGDEVALGASAGGHGAGQRGDVLAHGEPGLDTDPSQLAAVYGGLDASNRQSPGFGAGPAENGAPGETTRSGTNRRAANDHARQRTNGMGNAPAPEKRGQAAGSGQRRRPDRDADGNAPGNAGGGTDRGADGNEPRDAGSASGARAGARNAGGEEGAPAANRFQRPPPERSLQGDSAAEFADPNSAQGSALGNVAGSGPSGASDPASSPGGLPLPLNLTVGGPDSQNGARNADSAPARRAGTRGPSQRSVAEARGDNWALPAHDEQAMPVRRSIVIECHADYFKLVRDVNGSQGAIVVPLEGATDGAVDELAGRVWERIDSWGAAGANLYWKPKLELDVARGGEERCDDLQALLADSGFDVARRAPSRVVRYPRTATPD